MVMVMVTVMVTVMVMVMVLPREKTRIKFIPPGAAQGWLHSHVWESAAQQQWHHRPAKRRLLCREGEAAEAQAAGVHRPDRCLLCVAGSGQAGVQEHLLGKGVPWASRRLLPASLGRQLPWWRCWWEPILIFARLNSWIWKLNLTNVTNHICTTCLRGAIWKKRKKRGVEDVLSPSALSGGTPFIMGFRLSFFLFSKIVFEKKKTKTFLE